MSPHKAQTRKTAVALRYIPPEDTAPRIIASGYGEIARQILEIARQHDIPLHEDPAVAEALVKLEVGTEIPPEFYQIVAEILAFVYSLDKKWEVEKGN